MQRRFGQVRSLAYRAYVLVYSANNESDPTSDRIPLTFTEVYLGHVDIADFRKNARSELGTDNSHVPGSSSGRGSQTALERDDKTCPDWQTLVRFGE